jgi:hypothetical protein
MSQADAIVRAISAFSCSQYEICKQIIDAGDKQSCDFMVQVCLQKNGSVHVNPPEANFCTLNEETKQLEIRSETVPNRKPTQRCQPQYDLLTVVNWLEAHGFEPMQETVQALAKFDESEQSPFLRLLFKCRVPLDKHVVRIGSQ